MDGVKSVDVDFDKKLATCTVVAEKFDAKKAVAALNGDYGPSSVAEN
jgi:copper chaperone CopZ